MNPYIRIQIEIKIKKKSYIENLKPYLINYM